MALDYQSLDSKITSYAALGLSGVRALRLALLQTIANNTNPMAATDYQSLLSLPNVIGYAAASGAGVVDLLELGLLNIIAGGGGAVLNGSGSPVGVITPIAGQLYINNTDSTLWAVANGAWTQLV